jgi:hypothetical protein
LQFWHCASCKEKLLPFLSIENWEWVLQDFVIFMDLNYIIHCVLIVIMCDHFAIDPFCSSVFSLLCQQLPLFPIDCVGLSLSLSLLPLHWYGCWIWNLYNLVIGSSLNSVQVVFDWLYVWREQVLNALQRDDVILCLSVLVLEAKSTFHLSVICVQFIQKLSIFNACDWIIPVMFVQITITCLTTRSSKRCPFTATLAFGSLFFWFLIFLIFNFYV